MKKRFLLVGLCLVSLAVFAKPKYAFLFIGDGMAERQRQLAEVFSMRTRGHELKMNHFAVVATTATDCVAAPVTDSAAAATAIASGTKTKLYHLGLDANGKPLESVAVVAKKNGYKVGLITTVSIAHATPAAFFAHQNARNDYYAIALDLLKSDFDYLSASGVYDRYDDKRHREYRGDIRELWRQQGGRFLSDDKSAFLSLKKGAQVWCVFEQNHFPFVIDGEDRCPTLSQMVAKGIELMDGPQGFFMMCEGGEIDHLCHANDAASAIRETMAFDEAIEVAVHFAAEHPDETLIVVTGDHETGSLKFDCDDPKFCPEILACQQTSVEMFSETVKKLICEHKAQLTFDEVKPLVMTKFGLKFASSPADAKGILVTADEEKVLAKKFKEDVEKVKAKIADTVHHDQVRVYVFAQAVKNLLNARAGIRWRSTSHSNKPTITTAMGKDAEAFAGISDNTDIGKTLKCLLAK